ADLAFLRLGLLLRLLHLFLRRLRRGGGRHLRGRGWRGRGGRRGLLRRQERGHGRHLQHHPSRARHRGCSAADQRAAIPITWKPPSTWITSPVTPRPRAEIRNKATSPTSSCSVFFRSGAWVRWYSSIFESPCTPEAARVLMGPAEIAFTRIPRGPRSAAR